MRVCELSAPYHTEWYSIVELGPLYSLQSLVFVWIVRGILQGYGPLAI